jgi:hypothetical protein
MILARGPGCCHRSGWEEMGWEETGWEKQTWSEQGGESQGGKCELSRVFKSLWTQQPEDRPLARTSLLAIRVFHGPKQGRMDTTQ